MVFCLIKIIFSEIAKWTQNFSKDWEIFETEPKGYSIPEPNHAGKLFKSQNYTLLECLTQKFCKLISAFFLKLLSFFSVAIINTSNFTTTCKQLTEKKLKNGYCTNNVVKLAIKQKLKIRRTVNERCIWGVISVLISYILKPWRYNVSLNVPIDLLSNLLSVFSNNFIGVKKIRTLPIET